LTAGGSGDALLIAAHGARGGLEAAGNEAAFRLARNLQARGLTSEVAVGFIRGAPDIGTALGGLRAARVFVYPLFVANGYFTRDRLAELLDRARAGGREVVVAAPLGLDPGLPQLVADFAGHAAAGAGLETADCAVILLAHGSKKNPMSGQSTSRIAAELVASGRFATVGAAFLEQEPALAGAAAGLSGPIVVVGMFSGEGLHGASDVPRKVADLAGTRREKVVFAGVIGSAPGVEDLITAAVRRLVADPGTGDSPDWVEAAS